MAGIVGDVAGTVGLTPMVWLRRMPAGLPGRIAAKLEMRNPSGSVKDRVAVAMIDDAEQRGVLLPGATIVEATGGNTGIGLAFVAAVRGYRLVLTMPESMSVERVALLRHLGAEVELTPGILMTDAVARAAQLCRDIPGAVGLDQFANPVNPLVHRSTTGVEIWDASGGRVDAFVSAVGTGGTLTGVGGYLREKNPQTRIVAVEPASAALLSGGAAGQHQIPGIGVGFIPQVLDRDLIDEVIAVTDAEAFAGSRRLAAEEGILAGPSSGAAVEAAVRVASRDNSAGQVVVVILADSAERYINTALFTPRTPDSEAEGGG